MITKKEAQQFIADHLSGSVLLNEIASGNHSMAFSYELNGQEFVLRFNETDFGFKKDLFAYENFSSAVPIPKIIEIGTHNDLFFCISEKIEGHSIRDEYNQGNFESFPMQFDAIESISKIDVLNISGFEDYKEELNYDWQSFENVEGFEQSFVDELKQKTAKLSHFSKDKHELRHGDFGNTNVIVSNSKIAGVIDWHKASVDDHLFDVSRVVLYCPNRECSTTEAVKYYQNKEENFRERIMLGVYRTMLTNYGAAAKAGMTESLKSSRSRIEDIENILLN